MLFFMLQNILKFNNNIIFLINISSRTKILTLITGLSLQPGFNIV